jgi:hypothetical protein
MSNVTQVLQGELVGLQAETQRLESVIAQAQADLRVAKEKAEHINGLLTLYSPVEDLQPIRSTLNGNHPSARQSPLPDRQTKAARMRNHIHSLLLISGSMHRAAILDELKKEGLMGNEKSPMASLAAFLSDNRVYFEPDGRGNFMLRRESTGDSPPDGSLGETGGVAPPADSLTSPLTTRGPSQAAPEAGGI